MDNAQQAIIRAETDNAMARYNKIMDLVRIGEPLSRADSAELRRIERKYFNGYGVTHTPKRPRKGNTTAYVTYRRSGEEVKAARRTMW
jgi:hypothetical protein